MTYEQLLQKAPPTTAAGNKCAAKEYVTMIQAYLNAESASLSHSQKNYLYRLRGRWELRAQGQDESWNAYGNKPGPKRFARQSTLASTVDPTAFGDDEQKDPLLLSLERKYGTPKRTDDI